MLSKIRNAFVAGIAITFPILVTILIIRFLIDKINVILLNPLIGIFTFRGYLASPYAIFLAKAVVFILAIFVVTLVGWGANVIVLRRFFGMWEKLLIKVPLAGKIYSATKEISAAFIGKGKTIFKGVVLLEYPRKGIYSIGFVTGSEKGEISSHTGGEMINIFIPTTPNPTSGVLIFQPKSEAKFLKMSVDEGIKLIISGGAIGGHTKGYIRSGDSENNSDYIAEARNP